MAETVFTVFALLAIVGVFLVCLSFDRLFREEKRVLLLNENGLGPDGFPLRDGTIFRRGKDTFQVVWSYVSPAMWDKLSPETRVRFIAAPPGFIPPQGDQDVPFFKTTEDRIYRVYHKDLTRPVKNNDSVPFPPRQEFEKVTYAKAAEAVVLQDRIHNEKGFLL